MNRLCLFFASADKGIANNPLFSTAQRLVFLLAVCCQAWTTYVPTLPVPPVTKIFIRSPLITKPTAGSRNVC